MGGDEPSKPFHLTRYSHPGDSPSPCKPATQHEACPRIRRSHCSPCACPGCRRPRNGPSETHRMSRRQAPCGEWSFERCSVRNPPREQAHDINLLLAIIRGNTMAALLRLFLLAACVGLAAAQGGTEGFNKLIALMLPTINTQIQGILTVHPSPDPHRFASDCRQAARELWRLFGGRPRHHRCTAMRDMLRM